MNTLKTIIEIIEAPIFEGSNLQGVELSYSKIKKFHSQPTNIFFKDYFNETSVSPCYDSFGTKNITEVVTKCEKIRENVLNSFEKNHFPIIIGGDHSSAMGSITATSEFYGIDDLAVIYIDGHCDINTEETSVTHNIHGMPLASLIGLCNNDLQVGKLKRKVIGRNIFIIGSRSIDEPEYKIINENNVHLYTNNQISKVNLSNVFSELKNNISRKKVHISFDVDVLDPSVLSSTGYIMSNGISLELAKEIIAFAFENFDVVSFDLVEYNPLLDKDEKDIHIVLEILDFVEKILAKKFA